MNDRIEPADAARALSEIGRRRQQVIRRASIPGWYWCAQAVLTIGLTAAIESGRGVVLGIALFVAGGLVINVPVSRAIRAAPPRSGLPGPTAVRRALVGLATLLLVLVGLAIATALGLGAAGVPYPGTIAAAVGSAVLPFGWQMLFRYDMAVPVFGSRG